MALSERPKAEPGSISDVATRLISWSRRQSWGLARVEYISEFARERVLSSLRYALAEKLIPFHEIELPSYRTASEIVQFLVEQLNKVKTGVVSVSGFATAFEPDTKLEDSLRVLNFNRENLVLPTLRQIWWLPSSFAETFVPAVPDLDSWFNIRLYLTEPAPSQSFVPKGTDQDPLGQLSNLPARNPMFIGREDALLSIEDALRTTGAALITGVGGIGKTQIALEYAYRKRNNYKTLLWTLADSEDSLDTGLFRIAELLGLPEAQEIDQTLAVEATRSWLESNFDWLLILDEAADVSKTASLLGNHNGHVLLTSRRKLHSSLPYIDLLLMRPDESRNLLFSRSASERSNDEEVRAAEHLSKVLQCHPLTLDIASAYIGNKEISYDKYLMAYTNSDYEFLAMRVEPAPTLAAVVLSFRELNTSAQVLLKLCAFLNPNEIPVELLTWSAKILENASDKNVALFPQDIHELTLLLERYSLMHSDSFSNIWTLHPIVQENIREVMEQSEQRSYAERVVRLVSEIFSNPKNNWRQRDRFLPNALTVAELIENWSITSREAIRLLATLGFHLQDRGQRRRAEPLLRGVLRLATKLDQQDETITTAVLESLAQLYYDEGRYKEAKNLIENVLASQESTVGPESLAVALSLRVLARIKLAEKNYNDAESLLHRSLDIQRTLPDRDLTELITTVQDLAEVYLQQEQFAEAESVLKWALRIGESLLGAEHPSITQTLEGLASSYVGEQEYGKAKEIYSRLLSLPSQQEQPRKYAQALASLGYVHMLEESYPEAETNLRRALDIQRKTGNRWEVARILTLLSWLYASRSRYLDAEHSLREALAIQEDVVGPSHPIVLNGRKYYSTILHQLGRKAEATEIEKKIARMEAQLSSSKNSQ